MGEDFSRRERAKSWREKAAQTVFSARAYRFSSPACTAAAYPEEALYGFPGESCGERRRRTTRRFSVELAADNMSAAFLSATLTDGTVGAFENRRPIFKADAARLRMSCAVHSL